jgi:aspartate/glutamate racemase
MKTRIALIHALTLSIAPSVEAFRALWPEAECVNLLDDSLSIDRQRAGELTPAIAARIAALASHARACGAHGILYTCSAFGAAIEAVACLSAIPVLKPNEAMIDDAVRAAAGAGRRGRIGLIATFAPTLSSMPAEFPAGVDVIPVLAEGALAALDAGDTSTHDRLAADAARRAHAMGCDVIALAQFSLARAAPAVARAVPLPVLTTPASEIMAVTAGLFVRFRLIEMLLRVSVLVKGEGWRRPSRRRFFSAGTSLPRPAASANCGARRMATSCVAASNSDEA